MRYKVRQAMSSAKVLAGVAIRAFYRKIYLPLSHTKAQQIYNNLCLHSTVTQIWRLVNAVARVGRSREYLPHSFDLIFTYIIVIFRQRITFDL